MEGFISDYYAKPQAGQPFFERGAIVWAPCAFLMEKFVRLQPSHYNPASQLTDYYTAKAVLPDEIHRQENNLFHHFPVVEHSLGKNEEFAVTRYKLRKAVIYSTEIVSGIFSNEELQRLRIWFQDSFVALPVYTLETEQKQPKYPAKFIARVKAYAYPGFFHLPRGESFGMRESVVRFDRIQVIPKQFMRPARVRLSGDAMVVLEEWLRFYLFGELDEANGLVAPYRKEAFAKIEGLSS